MEERNSISQLATNRQLNLPATSLIICSRNRPQLLIDTVESILQGNEVPSEMIIVDQSDRPNDALATKSWTRDCRIQYVWSETQGLSRANNIGIAAASHDVLVFTHDDVLVTADWFGSIVRALQTAGSKSVITGRVLPTNSETTDGFAPSVKGAQAPATYTGRLNEDVLYPLNMAMFRSAITTIGLFDERLGPGTPFPGSEDSDFGFRLLEAGYQILYVPHATLYHRAWRTAREYLPLRWSYGRARGGFYAKYLSLRDPHMFKRMAKDVFFHSILCLRYLRTDQQKAFGGAALAMGILYGATKWALTQQKTP